MKRVIPLRVILVARTALGVLAALYGPTEPVYALLHAGGFAAECVVAAMTVLACVACADLILSETDVPAWAAVRRRRWAVWIALGTGHAMQCAVAMLYGFTPWVASWAVIDAVGCCWVAWLDIHYRFADACQVLRDTGRGELDELSPEALPWS